MATQRKFTIEEDRKTGNQLGVKQGAFDFEEFQRGLEVELEHGFRIPEITVTNDHAPLTDKSVREHVKRSPDYDARWIGWKPRPVKSRQRKG